MTRDSRVDRRFWTLLQASFYETYQRRGHRIFPHRVLDWVSPRTAAGELILASTLPTSEVCPGYFRWSRTDT